MVHGILTSASMMIRVGIEKFGCLRQKKIVNNQSDSKVGADGRKARGHGLKGGWGFINVRWTDGL